MNLARLHGGVVFVAMMTLVCGNSLRADGIDTTGGAASLVIEPAPDLDFGDLGLLAGSFLFEPNTMFDFTGNEVVEVLSAITDPGQSVLPLSAPGTTVTTFVVSDTDPDTDDTPVPAGDVANSSGDAVAAISPEPATGLLVAGGLGLLVLFAFRRVRHINRH
jgi:hypothetical protein